MGKLECFSCDNPAFHQRGEISAGTNSSLKMTQLNCPPEVTENNVAEMNESWRERFLRVENEPERIKSEKGSIEHRVHSVEADLVIVQTEKLLLEKDNENKQGLISCP